MNWFILFLFLNGHIWIVNSACIVPTKFYVECGTIRTISDATQLCLSHQMILLNLTNGSSTLTNDISDLNTTFTSQNCTGSFWYSSGSQTGLVSSTSALGSLLSSITNILNTVLCILPLILCPTTTTTAPILYAFTVCTRPMQQQVIQKCSTPSQNVGILKYQFSKQNMYAGVLNMFSSRSLITCSGICSSNNTCVGTTFTNGTCTLYM